METQTEANKNNRELTSSEVKLAIAEIENRFSILAKAQQEYSKLIAKVEDFLDTQKHVSDEDYDNLRECKYNEVKDKIREKYQIPHGVHLFFDDGDSLPLLPKHMQQLKKWINAFVRGQLIPLELEFLIHEMEESSGECDYIWGFLGDPAYFFEGRNNWKAPKIDNENLSYFDIKINEIYEIGTRSKTKKKFTVGLERIWNLLEPTY